jgi:hypothetical protein
VCHLWPLFVPSHGVVKLMVWRHWLYLRVHSKGEFVNLLWLRLKTAERKGNLLESIVLQADLEKSVAKTIRKQKDFRCIASLAIVLSEQNRLVLSKDIVRNGSHQALRCFAQHISWSQILNNGLILIHKNRKNSRLRDGWRKARYLV